MIRKIINGVKEFMKECNSPEMKKLRREAAISSRSYNVGYLALY